MQTLRRLSRSRRFTLALAAAATVWGAGLPLAQAQGAPKEVVIGYQDMVLPWRYAQETQAVEKATGYKVSYRKLGSGAEVTRALASGAIQIGEAGCLQRCTRPPPMALRRQWHPAQFHHAPGFRVQPQFKAQLESPLARKTISKRISASRADVMTDKVIYGVVHRTVATEHAALVGQHHHIAVLYGLQPLAGMDEAARHATKEGHRPALPAQQGATQRDALVLPLPLRAGHGVAKNGLEQGTQFAIALRQGRMHRPAWRGGATTRFGAGAHGDGLWCPGWACQWCGRVTSPGSGRMSSTCKVAMAKALS